MPQDGRRIKGSPDERTRARDRLREELLAAARALGEDGGGYDNVTIRKVADKVGYTAPVVYEHFANKRALLVAVVEQGFADLADALGRAQCPDAHGPAGGALTAVAHAYWAFATRHPHLYRLMGGLTEVSFGTAETPDSARECFRLLKAALVSGAPDHPANAHDRDAATDLYWAHLHGLVTLTLDGRIKGGAARARGLLDLLVELNRPVPRPDPR